MGGGNMAEAIIGGLLAGGVSMERNVVVADVAAERRALLGKQVRDRRDGRQRRSRARCGRRRAGVKPQQVPEALAAARAAFTDHSCWCRSARGCRRRAGENKCRPGRCGRCRTCRRWCAAA
jgi:pyrroline-5-carboxylate reductase